jgi:hypothetical protein
MSENQIPATTSDDVEGNAFRHGHHATDAEGSDEAPAVFKAGYASGEDDDVEGHSLKSHFSTGGPTAEDDDVEGPPASRRF